MRSNVSTSSGVLDPESPIARASGSGASKIGSLRRTNGSSQSTLALAHSSHRCLSGVSSSSRRARSSTPAMYSRKRFARFLVYPRREAAGLAQLEQRVRQPQAAVVGVPPELQVAHFDPFLGPLGGYLSRAASIHLCVVLRARL